MSVIKGLGPSNSLQKTKKRSFYLLIPCFLLALFLFSGCTNQFMDQILGHKISGNGTLKNPFRVYDEEDLRKVGSDIDGWSLDAHYRQERNITGMSKEWEPIGNYTNNAPFTGTYNGNGKSISTIRITPAGESCKGMFSYILHPGEVKNLRLNVDIDLGTWNVAGAVAGRNEGGLIQNCNVTGKISSQTEAGGIAGVNTNSTSPVNTGIIQYCISKIYIYNSGETVGGIAGNNEEGLIQNCYSTGDIGSTGQNVGGIAGYNENGTIQSCYSKSNISGNNSVGGIIGYNFNGLLKNCYSTGEIDCTGDNIGGIVGFNSGNVEYCYATGNVNGNRNVGGIAGDNISTVNNCVALNRYIETNGDPNFGRVFGNSTDPSSLNHARFNINNTSWIINQKNGYNIVQSDLDSIQTFWEDPSLLIWTSPWDFNGPQFIWAWVAPYLPILNNMPPGTQNPTIPGLP